VRQHFADNDGTSTFQLLVVGGTAVQFIMKASDKGIHYVVKDAPGLFPPVPELLSTSSIQVAIDKRLLSITEELPMSSPAKSESSLLRVCREFFESLVLEGRSVMLNCVANSRMLAKNKEEGTREYPITHVKLKMISPSGTPFLSTSLLYRNF
jgi:hypothetical protein